MKNDTCPVSAGSFQWRGWRRGISRIKETGSPIAWQDQWLCPVRYGSGEHGVVHVKSRMRNNGLETYSLDELRPEDGACARMLRTSRSMPEVVYTSGDRCFVCVVEDGIDFQVDVRFVTNGQPIFGELSVVPL